MSILNKNIVKITSEDLKDAALSSAGFNSEVKKRAFANILGARLAIKLLFSKKIEANNLYSLYTIQSVLKNFDISDIYFENIKIDIRLVFDKNEIFIPKSHIKYGLLPDIYIPLLLKKDMSSAEILGFFEPETINKANENKDFYFFEAEKLHKPESLKKFINLFIQKTPKKSKLEELQKSEGLFGDFIDGEISPEDKVFLIQQLNNNLYLREKLVELENFELLSAKAASEGIFTQITAAEELQELPVEETQESLVEETQESLSEEITEELQELPVEETQKLLIEETQEPLSEETTEELQELLVEEVQEPLSEEMQELLVEEIQEPFNEEPVTSDSEDIQKQEFTEGEVIPELSMQIQDLPEFTETTAEFEEYKEELMPIETLENAEEIEPSLPELQDGSDDLDEQVEQIKSEKAHADMSDKEFEKENLKSQIDEFMEEFKKSDESIAGEIEIIEDLISQSKDKPDNTQEDMPSEAVFKTASEDELEFITSEPEVEKKDKDLINILFEKENIQASDDMTVLPDISEKKKLPKIHISKKVIIAASVIGVLLTATVGGVIMTKNKAQNENLLVNNMNVNTGEMPADGVMQQGFEQTQYQPEGSMPQPLPGEQYQSRDMSKAVSDAFLSTPVNAAVSKIAWEVPEDLAYSDSFRKYLQMAGKNLKLTLQNDLLLSSEMAYSNKVVADISMNKNGAVKEAKINISSGSKQIDNIVLQSVKETLKYLKMPADEIQSSSVDLTLIINF